jgi:nickel/cobalt transporter (NicO) family protein
MPDVAQIIQASAANPWFYLPVAMVLGALHALEPGHAKSLMAAFIVAVRGTERQAVILGLSATVGHTIVVWVLAVLALMFGDKLIVERAEPWLVLLTGVLIVVLAVRVFGLSLPAAGGHGHHLDHHHHHDHDHHPPGDHGPHHDHGHGRGHSHDPGFAGRQVGTWEVAWFGFTGGLLPCPAATAVLLVCIQLKAFALGSVCPCGGSRRSRSGSRAACRAARG